MHGEDAKYMMEAYNTNRMSTVGKNLDEIEKQIAEFAGVNYAAGTAVLHLAAKPAGEKIYGQAQPYEGTCCLRKILCSDLTFEASINPVAYEDGEAVFVDTKYDTWNMNPAALEKSLELYPKVKIVVPAHLYGTPGKIEELKEICDRHGALIVEDAAENPGAKYLYHSKWKETGRFGTFNCISFNGNNVFETEMRKFDCKESTKMVA